MSAAPAAPSGSSGQAVEATAGWEAGKWGRFPSKRFDVSIPLPDGKGWRIDDHSKPWLVAAHGGTQSELRVRLFREDEPQTREKCEARARGVEPALPTADDGRLVMEKSEDVVPGWHARAFATVRALPGAGPVTLEGRYVAFAADVRKCLVVAFVTRAAGPTAEGAVGARLGDVSERVVRELRVEDERTGPSRVAPKL